MRSSWEGPPSDRDTGWPAKARYGLGSAAFNLQDEAPDRANAIVGELEQHFASASTLGERMDYLKALGNAGSIDALPLIQEQLTSDNANLRAVAVDSLRHMGRRPVPTVVGADRCLHCGVRREHIWLRPTVTQQAKVVCWGVGAPTSFNPSGTIVQLSSNDLATCARSSDGAVECHGNGTVDAVPVGIKFTDVSAGLDTFACGLDSSGAATWWGNLTMPSSVAMVPADDKFVRLTVSADIACGLRADGSARCWGYSPDRSVFDVPADERFSELAVGGDHVCGLRKTDSTVVCWGPDTDHQTEVPLSTK